MAGAYFPIPLEAAAQYQSGSGVGDVFSVLWALIATVIVIALAYFVPKWMAKKYSRTSSGQYIKIIERSVIGKDAYIAIINVGDKDYLISVSDKKVDVIDTFPPDSLPELPQQKQPVEFQNILSSLSGQFHRDMGLKNREGRRNKKQ